MRSVFLTMLVVGLAPLSRAADDENPWKKAKVGDWVEYKMIGNGFSGKTKMTITAKDDKEVEFETVATFTANGKEMSAPAQKQKIDLTKSYDPISTLNLQKTGTKIEDLGDGKEKLKIGDKEYDTKWIKRKSTTTVNGMNFVSEYKMWFSKDVPLGGLVRMDTTVSPANVTSTLELVGSGSK